MSYSFYCSRCKFDHAGECAVPQSLGPGGPITAHDWVEQPVTDLSLPYECSKCKRTTRITLVASMFSGNPKDLLIAGPCPGP